MLDIAQAPRNEAVLRVSHYDSRRRLYVQLPGWKVSNEDGGAQSSRFFMTSPTSIGISPQIAVCCCRLQPRHVQSYEKSQLRPREKRPEPRKAA